VRSVMKCYKQDRSRVWLVMRQLPASKGVNTEAEEAMWDFVMDKSGAGAGILRELRFPLPVYIPYTSPQSSSLSPEAGTDAVLSI
jgi:hypothetical protein